MIDKYEFDRTLEEIHRSLQGLAAKGNRGFDCAAQSLEKLERWGQGSGNLQDTLETVRADLGDCQRCQLAGGRNNIVFGDGDPHARLVFVGEGPGFEEDQQGLPFVGPAGQLLTRIIEAIKLDRNQVYICNVIKCRPPRKPQSSTR